jgi:hypothetical protein
MKVTLKHHGHETTGNGDPGLAAAGGRLQENTGIPATDAICDIHTHRFWMNPIKALEPRVRGGSCDFQDLFVYLGGWQMPAN